MTKQEFKEIRLALGLSRQQLASKLGILEGQIRRIERGVKYQPTSDRIASETYIKTQNYWRI